MYANRGIKNLAKRIWKHGEKNNIGWNVRCKRAQNIGRYIRDDVSVLPKLPSFQQQPPPPPSSTMPSPSSKFTVLERFVENLFALICATVGNELMARRIISFVCCVSMSLVGWLVGWVCVFVCMFGPFLRHVVNKS